MNATRSIYRLVIRSRRIPWIDRAEEKSEDGAYLDGGVATAVEDLPSLDGLDHGHSRSSRSDLEIERETGSDR